MFNFPTADTHESLGLSRNLFGLVSWFVRPGVCSRSPWESLTVAVVVVTTVLAILDKGVTDFVLSGDPRDLLAPGSLQLVASS